MKKYFIYALYIIIGCFINVDSQCLVVSGDNIWMGLWHGVAIPFSFIGSLTADCSIISLGAGFFYNLGFLIGAALCPVFWFSVIEVITNPYIYEKKI